MSEHTERDMTTVEFFSLPAIRAHLKGDAERAAAREADEMERADEREEMAGDTDEADERWFEMQEDLRAEEQVRQDSEIRRAEADYLSPRN